MLGLHQPSISLSCLQSLLPWLPAPSHQLLPLPHLLGSKGKGKEKGKGKGKGGGGERGG